MKIAKINFTGTKYFTILLTLSYIFALAAYYLHHQILFSLLMFLVSGFLVFFSNLSYKRILALYFIFFAGILRANSLDNIKVQNVNFKNANLEGKIISSTDIKQKSAKIKFYLKPDKIMTYKEIKTNSKVLVSLDLDDKIANQIHIGDYIKVSGKLTNPEPAHNPYQFDYKKYLQNNDCGYILYAEPKNLVKMGEVRPKGFEEDSWYYILRQFENTRNKILKIHSQNIKSPRLEILGGIVFGNETINPDEEVKESFRTSGLLHLLAASGLNVALIYGIWRFISGLIRLPYNLSIIIGCIFIIFYTFMTGFPPSILRASLMLLFVLFGKLIDRNADSVALIFFVGFLILLFSPKMIFDIGFQLSFAVTFGLIQGCDTIVSKFKTLDEKFKKQFEQKPRIQKYFINLISPMSLASIATVPLIAQLWVVPLQMHYFNNLAPMSIFANIAVVPFIGILSFIGFVSSIAALIPKLASFVVFLFDLAANPLLGLLIKISKIFSSFKYSLISTPALSVFQIFAFWIMIMLFVQNIKNDFKIKREVISLAALLIVFLLSFLRLDYFKHNLEIIMFDVGNADSFLIKTPKNKYILIDTGRLPYKGLSSGETVINRYFRNRRISNLEFLIITHFDSDHCGGALDVLKTTKAKQIIIQNKNKTTSTASMVLDYLENQKLNYKIAKNDEIIFEEDGLILKTFTTFENPAPNSNYSANEASIITLLSYKDKHVLFMADAGVDAYYKIKDRLPSKIDILKVGHHGALNVVNSDMLDYLKPKYALISTGANKFGHPAAKTIEELSNKKINIISTKNYCFSKAILEEDFKFYHFDKFGAQIKEIVFKEQKPSFHTSKYAQKLIKSSY